MMMPAAQNNNQAPTPNNSGSSDHGYSDEEIKALEEKVKSEETASWWANKTTLVLLAIYGLLSLAIAFTSIWINRSGDRLRSVDSLLAGLRMARIKSEGETEARRIESEARERLETAKRESDEKIAGLTAEAERAKTERAEADKQIAIAKADAARAKEGIANAEARSLEASAEVSRLRVTVANAETARAKAEKDLLEVQERIRPRHLTALQRDRLTARLKALPKGQIEVRCPVGNPEARDFATELASAFESAGWEVSIVDRIIMLPTPVGLQLWLHTDQEVVPQRPITEQAPERALSVIDAFKTAGLPLQGTFSKQPPKDGVWLVVGFKP